MFCVAWIQHNSGKAWHVLQQSTCFNWRAYMCQYGTVTCVCLICVIGTKMCHCPWLVFACLACRVICRKLSRQDRTPCVLWIDGPSSWIHSACKAQPAAAAAPQEQAYEHGCNTRLSLTPTIPSGIQVSVVHTSSQTPALGLGQRHKTACVLAQSTRLNFSRPWKTCAWLVLYSADTFNHWHNLPSQSYERLSGLSAMT